MDAQSRRSRRSGGAGDCANVATGGGGRGGRALDHQAGLRHHAVGADAQLKLELPKAYKVVNVFDANVQKWEVGDKEGDEATQVVTVQLFQPAKGQQALSVELELVDQELVKNGVKVPAIKAVEAARQFGIVAVRVTSSLRAEATSRSGLSSSMPTSCRRNWPVRLGLLFTATLHCRMN